MKIDSEHVGQRVWLGKDNLPAELQFIQPLNASDPQRARVMVSPRIWVNTVDTVDQTINANVVTYFAWHSNIITPNSWMAPPANAGVLFEMIRAGISCRDTSAKLEVTIPLLLYYGQTYNCSLTTHPSPLPMLYPAVIGAFFEIRAQTPMPPYLPSDGAMPNGPTANMGITNTDAAAPHTYRRWIAYCLRYIYDIDWTKERV